MRSGWVPILDGEGHTVRMEWRTDLVDVPSARSITIEDHLAWVDRVGAEPCRSHSIGDRIQCELDAGHALPHEAKAGQLLWVEP